MRTMRQAMTWLVPVGIAALLFMAAWGKAFTEERQLPSEGWSRTIHPSLSTDLKQPFVDKNRDGVRLYTIDRNQVHVSLLTPDLKLKPLAALKTGAIDRIIWAKDRQVIYMRDDGLYRFDGKSVRLLAERAEATACVNGEVFYSDPDRLKAYDTATGKTETVAAFQAPVEAVAAYGTKGAAKIVAITKAPSAAYRFYMISEDHPALQPRAFAQWGSNFQGTVGDVQLIEHGGNAGIFYTTHIFKQGDIVSHHYFERPFNQLENPEKPTVLDDRPLSFIDNATGADLRDPDDLRLAMIGGKPVLLFSAKGKRTLRDDAINIYEAHTDPSGRWVAERRSTSPNISRLPFFIDEQTIAWLDLDSGSRYQIGLASRDPHAIELSMKVTAQDFSQSFSEAALSISRIFILFLLSIGYAIPAIAVYALIAFLKVEWIERDSPWVKRLVLGAFLIAQYFLASRIKTPLFQHYAPGYLSFPMSEWVIPTVLAVAAWLLTRWVKRPAWSILAETFYAMGLFAVMELFAFGPYFF